MKKVSMVLAAVVLVLGLSQCKKQEQQTTTDTNGTVAITLDVRGGASTGSATDGSRINVNPNNGVVNFEYGDVVYVASGQKFVGTLTNNGSTFVGNITNPTEGEPLYFFFLGNKTPEETLTPGSSNTCSVNISDQTNGYPVISFATSNETFTGSGLYTAFFLNKAALVKFNVTTLSSNPTCILGLNNKVTVDFSTNGFVYSQDGEGIITLPSGSGERWAILLPQAEVTDAVAQSHGVSSIGTCGTIPAIASNDYLTAGIVVTITAYYNDYPYVDLGLPSGLLWATCNVGADNPEDYGDYFAWGETQPKDIYNWSTYQYCNGSDNTLTKYCTNSSYGYNGFTDNLTTLLPEDNAATANWGNGWRMPTKEEWQELYQNTTHTGTTQNGVNGCLFTASNGNSLFLPATGCRYDSSLDNPGVFGYYWSSSLYTDYDFPDNAWMLHHFNSDSYMGTSDRCCGQSVRPVRVGSQN